MNRGFVCPPGVLAQGALVLRHPFNEEQKESRLSHSAPGHERNEKEQRGDASIGIRIRLRGCRGGILHRGVLVRLICHGAAGQVGSTTGADIVRARLTVAPVAPEALRA